MHNCTIEGQCAPEEVYIGYVYFLTGICTLGTVFNVMNLCVFHKKSFKTKISPSTLHYLTGLAIADATASFSMLSLGLSRCIHLGNTTLGHFWNVYQMFIFLPVSNSFGTASVWITLIISAERCIFITWCSGLACHREGLCPNNTRTITIAIFVVAFIFNIPFWFDYDIDVTLATGVLTFSEFSKSTFYEVWLWIRIFVVKIIPICAVVIFNCILLKTTRINNDKYKIMNVPPVMSKKRQTAQTRMTAMLTSISTVFVICHSLEPFVHTPIYTSIAGACGIYSELYNFLVVTVNVSEAISYASNFVSYWIFNKQFVITLKLMASCMRTHKVDVDVYRPTATFQTGIPITSLKRYRQ